MSPVCFVTEVLSTLNGEAATFDQGLPLPTAPNISNLWIKKRIEFARVASEYIAVNVCSLSHHREKVK
jgi:hypothetical protein